MEMRIGDRVKLRSGGPLMTVVQVVDEKTVKCVWFDTSHHKLGDNFPIAVLIYEGSAPLEQT